MQRIKSANLEKNPCWNHAWTFLGIRSTISEIAKFRKGKPGRSECVCGAGMDCGGEERTWSQIDRVENITQSTEARGKLSLQQFGWESNLEKHFIQGSRWVLA